MIVTMWMILNYTLAIKWATLYVVYDVYYNYHYYYGWHNEEPEHDVVGIIVDVDYACWDGYEDDFEILYVVHCTDGIRDFFSEEELFKTS